MSEEDVPYEGEKGKKDNINELINAFREGQSQGRLGSLHGIVEEAIAEQIWCEVRNGDKFFVFKAPGINPSRQVAYPAIPFLEMLEDIFEEPVPHQKYDTRTYQV